MLYFAVHIDLTSKDVLNYARMLQLPAGSDGDGWYGLSFAGHFLSLVCIHYELRVTVPAIVTTSTTMYHHSL